MNQIYFTSDLHFGHSNILKHSPKRPYSDTVDIAAHDEWLLDLWRSTVDKRDTIYILGDLTFLKSDDARHPLEKYPGHKFLIEGNHDGSVRAYKHYFQEVYQIKEMRFRPTVAPFLKEDLGVVMCHYPMVTWNQKPRGSRCSTVIVMGNSMTTTPSRPTSVSMSASMAPSPTSVSSPSKIFTMLPPRR